MSKELFSQLCIGLALVFFSSCVSPFGSVASATVVTNVLDLRVTSASLDQVVLDWNPPVAEAGSVTDYVVSLRYAGIQKTLVFNDGVHSESGITIKDFPLGTALKFSVTAMFGKTKSTAT